MVKLKFIKKQETINYIYVRTPDPPASSPIPSSVPSPAPSSTPIPTPISEDVVEEPVEKTVLSSTFQSSTAKGVSAASRFVVVSSVAASGGFPLCSQLG